MTRKMREYIAEHFYNLCRGDDEDTGLNLICLNCGMRIGAHGYDEFTNCAVEYLGDANE